MPELESTVETEMIVSSKQGRVAERRYIMEVDTAPFLVMMASGDDGIDLNLAQSATFRTDPATQRVERGATTIGDHAKVVEFRGLLVAQPLQWHARDIGTQHL